jgi:glycosyltransferase involved in cell wall biosynthesis
VELADVAEPPERRARADSGDRELLLAGAVYWAQRDAIARLLGLRGRIPDLEIVAVGNEQTLHAHGLHADRYEPALPGPQFAQRLARADALFLGLSFDSDHPDVVRTATPARLVEYMASGRPLLIHAPRGSHVAEYARREDFAQVVDVADPEQLRTALAAVLDDAELSRTRASRARRIAQQRHDATRVRAEFTSVLDQLDIREPRPRRGGRPRFRNTDAMANANRGFSGPE